MGAWEAGSIMKIFLKVIVSCQVIELSRLDVWMDVNATIIPISLNFWVKDKNVLERPTISALPFI